MDDTGKPTGDSLRLFLNKKKVGGSPLLQGSIGARFEIVRGLSLNLDWYFNDMLYSSIEANAYTREDAMPLRLPAYHTLDGGVTYRYQLPDRFSVRSLTFRGNVNNIYNFRYIVRAYTNIQADETNPDNNWRGINKDNMVNFGYGLTWNVGLTMSW